MIVVDFPGGAIQMKQPAGAALCGWRLGDKFLRQCVVEFLDSHRAHYMRPWPGLGCGRKPNSR